MKSFLVCVSLVLFSTFLATAQVDGNENNSDEPRFYPEHSFSRFNYKPSFSLNTGVGLGRWGNSSFYNSFLNPHIGQQISNRFSVGGGLMLMHHNFTFSGSSASEGAMPPLRNGNFNQAVIYGSGSYLVNDRLMITGDAFYSLHEQNPYFQQFNGRNGKGFSMGFDYKVSDKISIGGGIRYAEGMNSWGFGNPMMMGGPGMFGSPFRNSFGNGFNNWW